MGIIRKHTKQEAEAAMRGLGFVPVPNAKLPKGYCNDEKFTWWWSAEGEQAGAVSEVCSGLWQGGWYLQSDRESFRIGCAMGDYSFGHAAP